VSYASPCGRARATLVASTPLGGALCAWAAVLPAKTNAAATKSARFIHISIGFFALILILSVDLFTTGSVSISFHS
jgi:hypothetical protein